MVFASAHDLWQTAVRVDAAVGFVQWRALGL